MSNRLPIFMVSSCHIFFPNRALGHRTMSRLSSAWFSTSRTSSRASRPKSTTPLSAISARSPLACPCFKWILVYGRAIQCSWRSTSKCPTITKPGIASRPSPLDCVTRWQIRWMFPHFAFRVRNSLVEWLIDRLPYNDTSERSLDRLIVLVRSIDWLLVGLVIVWLISVDWLKVKVLLDLCFRPVVIADFLPVLVEDFFMYVTFLQISWYKEDPNRIRHTFIWRFWSGPNGGRNTPHQPSRSLLRKRWTTFKRNLVITISTCRWSSGTTLTRLVQSLDWTLYPWTLLKSKFSDLISCFPDFSLECYDRKEFLPCIRVRSKDNHARVHHHHSRRRSHTGRPVAPDRGRGQPRRLHGRVDGRSGHRHDPHRWRGRISGRLSPVETQHRHRLPSLRLTITGVGRRVTRATPIEIPNSWQRLFSTRKFFRSWSRTFF